MEFIFLFHLLIALEKSFAPEKISPAIAEIVFTFEMFPFFGNQLNCTRFVGCLFMPVSDSLFEQEST